MRFKKLGDVGEFIRGSGLQKSELTGDGAPAIHYGEIHTYYGTWTCATKSFTEPALAARLRRAKPGDLVIATTSEDDAAVGKATAWIGEGEVAVSGDAYIYRHTLDPRYVAYFFQSDQFQGQKIRHITGTKVRRLSGDSLKQLRIPIPPIEVQREIVTILDQFRGLEAELEAELEEELGGANEPVRLLPGSAHDLFWGRCSEAPDGGGWRVHPRPQIHEGRCRPRRNQRDPLRRDLYALWCMRA